MAAGDAAAAVGMDVVPSTADAREGYTEINVTRDYLAEHQTDGTHAWDHVTGKPATFPSDWSTTAGKPPTFPPAAHNQGWDTIAVAPGVGLDTYVASKRAAGNDEVRYAHGPTADAYARTVSGSGFFQVWMDSSLTFGRNVSSARYKEDILPADLDPADVLALEPVTYHRKGSPEGVREFGLIAEQVNDHLPDVVTWFAGEIDGVRYDLIAAALLTVVKDQEARITALTERLDAIEARTPEGD